MNNYNPLLSILSPLSLPYRASIIPLNQFIMNYLTAS
ncbi:hypothetical protein [Staphylococcus phage vB_ScaM-V1SC01]|nr:hypothetical protein [Staphylococcus phage vB_ScaM-V1SC01]